MAPVLSKKIGIFLEGVSACGKTSTLKYLAKKTRGIEAEEFVTSERMPAEVVKSALGEITFGVLKTNQIWEKRTSTYHQSDVVFFDRTHLASLVYSMIWRELDGLPTNEDGFEASVQRLTKIFKPEDVVIMFLPNDTESCLKNLQRRGNWDSELNIKYIETQKKWFKVLSEILKNNGITVLEVVDMFKEDGSFDSSFLEEIEKFVEGRIVQLNDSKEGDLGY